MQAMHALTIALAAVQIVQFPITILTPFVPVMVGAWLWVLLQIYKIALAANALKAVYEFKFFVALGVWALSAILIGLSAGALLALPSLFPT